MTTLDLIRKGHRQRARGNSTHWVGCVEQHPDCAIAYLLEENEGLTENWKLEIATSLTPRSADGVLEDTALDIAVKGQESLRAELFRVVKERVALNTALDQNIADWAAKCRLIETECHRLGRENQRLRGSNNMLMQSLEEQDEAND